VSRVASHVREQVRQRAGGRCEYCRNPEEIYPFGHHVDHSISLKHDGSSELSNLAWACFDCNVAKGSDVAGYDEQTGELVPFFNPRIQAWDKHFTLNGFRLEGLTPVGRVTARLFRFNDIGQIEFRRQLLKMRLW
jgi:hypothetical protein